jgi:hypothetical protein
MRKARNIKEVCVTIRMLLLFILSASTPPNRESRNIGIELKNPTSPNKKAELVSLKTSQLWAVACTQVPIKETNMLSQ